MLNNSNNAKYPMINNFILKIKIKNNISVMIWTQNQNNAITFYIFNVYLKFIQIQIKTNQKWLIS